MQNAAPLSPLDTALVKKSAYSHTRDLRRGERTILTGRYTQKPLVVKPQHYDVFEQLDYPDPDRREEPSVWVALLEAGLPSHLRHHASSQGGEEIDAAHIAQILIAAQRVNELTNVEKEGVDPLFHLGVVQGRWNAVVWIVKRLVEAFGGQGLHNNRDAERIFPWKSEQPLWQLTTNEIDLGQDVTIFKSSPAAVNMASKLDEDTQDAEEKSERHEILRRDCLGHIWRSLGHMTMVCADDGMKPEILEIIAYLHHMEIMPMSIYNQRPSPDSTAIQQPPTLRLFSSRILTSLSDAAWRAHEKRSSRKQRPKVETMSHYAPRYQGWLTEYMLLTSSRGVDGAHSLVLLAWRLGH